MLKAVAALVSLTGVHWLDGTVEEGQLLKDHLFGLQPDSS